MRGATIAINTKTSVERFQSTLLMRGATFLAVNLIEPILISIHAPHARSDILARIHRALCNIISIHAPHARSD